MWQPEPAEKPRAPTPNLDPEEKPWVPAWKVPEENPRVPTPILEKDKLKAPSPKPEYYGKTASPTITPENDEQSPQLKSLLTLGNKPKTSEPNPSKTAEPKIYQPICEPIQWNKPSDDEKPNTAAKSLIDENKKLLAAYSGKKPVSSPLINK